MRTVCAPLMGLLAFSALLLGGASSARSETVVLKNGEELGGKLLEQNDASILLQVEYGTLRLGREKILEIRPEAQALPARDAEAANRRKAEELMKAAGKVLYQGKWVTPEERAAAEAKLAADLKKKADLASKSAQQAQAVAAQANASGSWIDQYVTWRRALRHGDAGKNSSPLANRNTQQNTIGRTMDNYRQRTGPYSGMYPDSRNGTYGQGPIPNNSGSMDRYSRSNLREFYGNSY